MRTLILGGARCGKSALAQRLAGANGGDVVYIATATAGDAEMATRIAHHRAERPAMWTTIEEPLALAAALRKQAHPGRTIIVDCLTLWLTNLLLSREPASLDAERAALLTALPELPGDVLFVSNEVGCGIVPADALSRRFVDESGRLHQALAARCERVLRVVAGLVQPLKGRWP
ncbi:MAG TPA: bifunctional adenosylcobinamide kinase/adenosylcobinamide-phosphate guanylyltransferase [Nevskiaceae bacterium]|nr:bifunctional adenosylcobinamide kinase/adenosylcobinamide-phosphate guanylyltransferase [Nevskiaceae bacterium]